MIDDVAINKAAIIRRCLARIAEDYRGDPARLDNFTIQDAVVLNLLRACESAIDLAMHQVAVHRLGIPQSSRDAFEILSRQGLLAKSTAAAMAGMVGMVGFRNIAVHNYQEIALPVLTAILDHHLGDFESLLTDLAG
jgi:uncharacterized protein YutE (UPF0331/DUF86 family)